VIRAAIYYRKSVRPHAEVDLSRDLRQAVEGRGAVVVATYIDDDGATVRTRNARWKALLTNLDAIDQVIASSADDLPGKSVRDLLKVLGTLRDHGVGLCLHREGIDTSSSPAFTLLDIVEAHRRARLSRAIRNGQARCVAAGKVIGRPAIRPGVRIQIQAYLAQGAGLRSTARRFNVSPGSVINIRRSATATLDK
jgi:DNA invertase Pin-like site-specific DNA recombinase